MCCSDSISGGTYWYGARHGRVYKVDVLCVCVYHIDPPPPRVDFLEISHLRFLQNSVDILQFCLKSYTDKTLYLRYKIRPKTLISLDISNVRGNYRKCDVWPCMRDVRRIQYLNVHEISTGYRAEAERP